MVRKFDFKRDIFYEALAALREYPVVFLYGARHTGKTICLRQLAEELPGAEYYNFMTIENRDAYYVGIEIEKCLKRNEPRTFLVDNPADCMLCGGIFEGIGYAFEELDENARRNTRIVFAGASPQAMKFLADKHFGDMAKHIVSDFPSYSEWLRFYGASDNPENREHFMFDKSGLNNRFASFDGFLKGCLAETEVVYANAANAVYGHSYGRLDENPLKDILFAALAREFGEDLKDNDVVSRHLNAFSYLASDTLEHGNNFLLERGLITSAAEPFDPATTRISHPFLCAELLRYAFDGQIPPEIKRAAISLYFKQNIPPRNGGISL